MQKAGRIIKIVLFFLILAAALAVTSLVVERKESRRKYADMFRAAENTDVLFLGSSHVINAVNPVQLYEEYGIASYNLGGHGSIMPATYWELVNALDYFSPKMAVIDGYMMERDYHYLDEMTENDTDELRKTSVSQLHLNFDVFPLSRNKYRAVKDLISDGGIRNEFLFPFILYHGRWTGLTEDDFRTGAGSAEANRLLGSEIRTRVAWQISPHYMGDDEQTDEIHLGEQYLQMIFQTCRENNIDIVLTFLPFNSTAADRKTADRLGVLAESEGIPYLNLLGSDVTDFTTDYNDEGHLNLSGMTKVTARIGEFLSGSESAPDRRGDANYSLWEERIADHRAALDGYLCEAGTLSEAMLALKVNRGEYNAVLYMEGNGAAIGDPSVRNLITSMQPDNGMRGAAFAGEPEILIFETDGSVRELSGYGTTEWEDVGFASMETIRVEGFSAVYLNGDESVNLLDMEDDRLADAQLVLLDPETCEITKRLIFNYSDLYGSGSDEE